MRVSSLSDRRVIELIGKYFVPAWVSRDFYQLEGDNVDEKAEVARLDGERHKRGLEGGTVCVFIVAPNGDVLATQRVQLAYKAEHLIPFLQKIILEQKLRPRSAEAIRASAAEASAAKPKTKDGRLVHIWTRVDTGDNRGLSNDRVELTAAEWKEFLAPANARPGTTWEIPEKIAHKLFQYGYPPAFSWKASDCKVLRGVLQATLIQLSGEQALIQLRGEMVLSFPPGKPAAGRITARFVGAVREDRKAKTLTSLALVSEKADFVWYWQGKPQPRKMRIALELEP